MRPIGQSLRPESSILWAFQRYSARAEGGTPMGTLVNYATEKGVALFTLNDPPVNSYTYEMFRELDAAVLEARFDNDVHVIVVTGHGDKYFCAGANINMLREAD